MEVIDNFLLAGVRQRLGKREARCASGRNPHGNVYSAPDHGRAPAIGISGFASYISPGAARAAMRIASNAVASTAAVLTAATSALQFATIKTRGNYPMQIRTVGPSSRAACLALGFGLAATLAGEADAPPVAAVKPVTDTYFGTPFTDNYRYLENLQDPQVQGWMRAQAGYTRAVLDKLPSRSALLERIPALVNADTQRGGFILRGKRYFYELVEPGAQQPKLMYGDGLKGEERLLIDPAKLATDPATHYALDYYTPSWDGRLVAYGLSAGGSEASTLHLIEVESGKVLDESITRTNNSVIAWRQDNHSFYYLRYAQPTPQTPAAETMYNARTYLHAIGVLPDGDQDAVVFGRGVAKAVEVPDGQGTYLVGSAQSPYFVPVRDPITRTTP